MGKDIKINLDLSTGDAEKDLSKVNKQIEGIEKNGSKAPKVFKSIGKAGSAAFKGIGAALKGLGIGLLLAALASLFEAFKKNQAIMDAFEKVTNIISQVVNGLVQGFKDLKTKLNESTGGFDALKSVMTNLLKIAVKPLQFAFNGIKLGIQSAQLAWEKSVFGGKDQNKIKELEGKVQATKDRIKELKDETVDSAKAVGSNIVEAVGEIGQAAKGAVEVVSDVVKKTTDGTYSAIAEQAVAAQKAFEKLKLEREKLQLQGETTAEQLRQQRDDETNYIQERIEANERLGEALAAQADKEINNIDKQIKATRDQIAVEGETEELKNRLIELENKRLDVQNRITGQQSEQLSNQKTLAQEQLDLEREFQDQLSEIKGEYREAEQERILLGIENEKERKEQELEFLKENLEIEREIELEALERKLEEKALTEEQYAALVAATKKKFAKEAATAEAEYEAATKEFVSKKDDEKLKNEKDNKKEGLEAVSSAFGFEQGIAAKDTAMATYEGAQKAFNAMAEIPVVGPILGGIAAAAVIVSGLSRVSSILSESKPAMPTFQSGGIVGGNSFSGDNITARVNSGEMILNKVQQSRLFNMLDSDSGNNTGISDEHIANIAARTVKAIPVYVVESEITETKRKADVRESGFSS